MPTSMNLHMMSRASRFSSIVGLMALALALFPETYIAKKVVLPHPQCFPSSCGNISSISYPFHLKGHPRGCGDGYHELACENNRTTFYLSGVKYYVQDISYKNQTIRLVDVNISNDYCSIPRKSFPFAKLYRYISTKYNDICIPHFDLVAITSGMYIIIRISIGLLCLIALVAYTFRQKHMSMDDTIENFLRSQNNLMPIRYSYSDIKQMTRSFRDKLGQGGYGTVFEGKLRCGDLVAVKVLGMSKANGQDFINEVATIGRIHHVNVVRLIGFCAEGSRKALVYDFMPNGSLDKFIFSRGEKNLPFISWERMYEIAVGVARGIEYLHRGCDMQILHFDIKPHNILLDLGFVPKVSDFGLAKLYPTDDSIVSLTAARGTLGYIAPELFYKNIGGVSYKADVYSFGMLLMEMVGKRKNLNAHAEHTSEIYFPYWIYDHIDQGEDLKLEDVNGQEKICARKMIIAALWCIQLKPVDRPSMSEVLQMLEGEEELLQMPPKPFLYSGDTSVDDQPDNHPIGLSNLSHAEMSITIEEMLR